VFIYFLTIFNKLNLSEKQYPENSKQSNVYAGYTFSCSK